MSPCTRRSNTCTWLINTRLIEPSLFVTVALELQQPLRADGHGCGTHALGATRRPFPKCCVPKMKLDCTEPSTSSRPSTDTLMLRLRGPRSNFASVLTWQSSSIFQSSQPASKGILQHTAAVATNAQWHRDETSKRCIQHHVLQQLLLLLLQLLRQIINSRSTLQDPPHRANVDASGTQHAPEFGNGPNLRTHERLSNSATLNQIQCHTARTTAAAASYVASKSPVDTRVRVNDLPLGAGAINIDTI